MGTAQQLIDRLCLKPHPEGGYFRETYRSSEHIGQDALPRRYTGARSFGTAVYYLLTAETFSAIHRVITDEIWHFYCGDSVEMLQLSPDGSGFVTTLGSDIERNATPGCRSLGDMARGTARPGWKIRFAGHDGRSRI